MADDIYVFETLKAAGASTVTDDGSGSDWIIIDGGYFGGNLSDTWGSRTYLGQINSNTPGDGAWIETTQFSPLLYKNLTVLGVIENARGGAGNDLLAGNNGANILQGDPFDVAGATDHLNGLGGNDTLLGGGGDDTLDGGDGNDTLFGDNDPFAQDQGNFASGSDILSGGAGDDVLAGGEGNNTYDGGDGFDTVDYQGFYDQQVFGYRLDCDLNTQIATVYYIDFYDGTEFVAATDHIYPIERVIGSGGDDHIKGQDNFSFGQPGSNTLDGGAGNDVITGGYWNDYLFGGAGNDTIDDGLNLGVAGLDELTGGTGDDTYIVNMACSIFETAGGGTDTIIAKTSFTIAANVENLILFEVSDAVDAAGNAMANRIAGNSFNNTIRGHAGNDFLNGLAGEDRIIAGAGNDRLTGGLGKDVLSGNAGKDIFDFNTVTESTAALAGRDIITDFNANSTDRIDLSTIDAISGLAGNNAFTLHVGAFTDLGQVHVIQRGANTFIEVNTTGSLAADMRIQLTGLVILDVTDFVL